MVSQPMHIFPSATAVNIQNKVMFNPVAFDWVNATFVFSASNAASSALASASFCAQMSRSAFFCAFASISSGEKCTTTRLTEPWNVRSTSLAFNVVLITVSCMYMALPKTRPNSKQSDANDDATIETDLIKMYARTAPILF